jgi:DNA polymerase-4
VSVKTDGFLRYSHQVQLSSAIDMTSEIYRYICELFDQCWKGEPIRHLGVAVSDLSNGEIQQISLFEKTNLEREKRLDKTIDGIRKRYGDRAIIRGTFTNGGLDPLQGGTNDGDYIMMGGYGSEDPSRAH